MRRRLTHTLYFTALLLILVLSFIHVPMATSQNSEEIIGKLRGLQEKVLALPLDEAFENIHAAEGQRKALANKIGAVIHQIEAGACEGAINKLENDLKGKVGLWITPEYEAELIELIDAIISLIKGEVPPPPEDTTPPNITSVLRVPETPNYDEDVTVVAHVEDEESGVDLVILSYSTNTVDWTNVTMNLKDSLYITEIPAQPYNVNVSYEVYAYDSAGNSAVSDTYSYVVIDSHPPVISEVERSPISPNYTDTVSVTASVTEPEEASGVQLVILSYSYGVTWKNMTMTLKEATIYEGSIPPLPYGTTVEYLVYASDNAENWGFSSTYSYTVGAPAPIHDIAVIDVVPSPHIVKVGGTVAINVTVLNEGTMTETFNISVYYSLTLLETRTLVVDAGAETTPTFTWVTTSEGVYLIWAEVQPLPGETDVADNVFVDGTVTVSSLQPPVASFTFSPEAPHTGQNVTFDASSSYDPDGTIASYAWSFGDGATGDGKIVTHSYADNGTYEVELTVVDNDGLTDIESESITVLNRPPVASFTESAETTYVGDAITFNASESHDPDGYIVSYFWNFGDGANATDVIVEHAYAVNGTFTVTLTVTDDDGASASANATKTILVNESPVAIFTESAETVYTGEAIAFNATDSYDPDGSIISYFWTFGDGNNATGMVVEHSYVDDGVYVVTLTVTDDKGAIGTATANKTVLNRPPVANFTESAETVLTGEVVCFNASASYDPDGIIVGYFWDFGDGTNDTGTIVCHAYTDDGAYVVTLTITDDDGATASTNATKTVLNRLPIANFTESAETVYTSEVIYFDASASYDSDGTIVSYLWDFGDGANGTGVTVDHAYTDDRSYVVTLTVTDDDGSTATAVAFKTISNRPPTAAFTHKAKTAYSGEVIRFDASASFDPDGYVTSYFWTFGDGTNATDMVVTHAYADDGSYMVTLTVTDNDGATASSTATRTVLNRHPVASFIESATTVFAGEVIQFNASASYDPDGSIVSYAWNFGDGNITTTSAPTINHTYTTPRTYNVTLTVTDDDGLTDDEVKTVTVEAAPWPLSLIIVIILLIVAATATAIYLVRKWRRKIKASIAAS